MGKFVKRQNAIGWDWYLETDEESSWVSHMVKEYIERLEAENAKLRELVQRMWRFERFGCYGCRRECDVESCYASDCKEAVEIEQEMHDLGIEVPQ